MLPTHAATSCRPSPRPAAAGRPVADIEAQATSFLTSPEIVHIDDRRFTTRELLATEQRLLATADEQRESNRATADRSEITAALDRRPSLTEEQRYMVQTLTCSPNGTPMSCEPQRAPARPSRSTPPARHGRPQASP